ERSDPVLSVARDEALALPDTPSPSEFKAGIWRDRDLQRGPGNVRRKAVASLTSTADMRRHAAQSCRSGRGMRKSASVKVFRCGPRRDGGGWACVGPRGKTSHGGSRG